jgi:hypothetical protein
MRSRQSRARSSPVSSNVRKPIAELMRETTHVSAPALRWPHIGRCETSGRVARGSGDQAFPAQVGGGKEQRVMPGSEYPIASMERGARK